MVLSLLKNISFFLREVTSRHNPENHFSPPAIFTVITKYNSCAEASYYTIYIFHLRIMEPYSLFQRRNQSTHIYSSSSLQRQLYTKQITTVTTLLLPNTINIYSNNKINVETIYIIYGLYKLSNNFCYSSRCKEDEYADRVSPTVSTKTRIHTEDPNHTYNYQI